MTDEQILERAAEADRRGATELHIVGGLHHQLPYEWYLNVIRIIHQAHPRLHLKAYTAVEWDWFARLTGRPTRDLLAEFKDAGLGSLPGGGAEIFHPEVRDKICEHKADAARVAAHPPRGPRARPALQRHHALRPHRGAAPPHRSPDPAARVAGRDGRLPDVHPAGVPPRQHQAGAHAQAERPDGPEDDGGQPADARQLRAHQGVLGHARHQDGPGGARASGPTTWTARWSTRRSTTTPAPTRRRS